MSSNLRSHVYFGHWCPPLRPARLYSWTTARWLDDCCRPIAQELWGILICRSYILHDTVTELQASHPDSVVEMVSASQLSLLGEDGKVRSARSGALIYGLDEVYQQGLTRAYDDIRSAKLEGDNS
eukprot:SAG31_NODE_5075_length_2760_cov_1.322059_2_plen_125_part_00